ncbi:MAG: 23S rRNA (pseudouridine(1915)-N(3))-methyltransferase RlmH [Bacteroidales bacterium]|nr:23S rRNA (pseudouridine(1915)-N(3))-methyltransferase RlmH [Bacteroidales bacterium]
MTITVFFTGKTTDRYLKEGIAGYEKRIRRYLPFVIRELSPGKMPKDIHAVKLLEGKLLLKSLDKKTFVILLDERGERFSSVQFARILEKKMVEGNKDLVFIIGGAFGVSEEIYRRADRVISLSSMTFSHQVVRILLMEQLYRALTIIHGEPYHHA